MPETPPVPTEPPVPTAPPVEPAPPAQETDWKAEARKWEERAKANKSAAEKLAEIEEASKTETQKALERAERAEKALAAREATEALASIRADVAQATGVPATALRGTTKEELEAHAAELKPLLAGVSPVIPTQGTTPTAPPESALREFAHRLFERAAD